MKDGVEHRDYQISQTFIKTCDPNSLEERNCGFKLHLGIGQFSSIVLTS